MWLELVPGTLTRQRFHDLLALLPISPAESQLADAAACADQSDCSQMKPGPTEHVYLSHDGPLVGRSFAAHVSAALLSVVTV